METTVQICSWEPHHIASADSMNDEAVQTRKLLAEYNIDLNSAANGVWMAQVMNTLDCNDGRWSGDLLEVTEKGTMLKNYWMEVHKRLKETEVRSLSLNRSGEDLATDIAEALHDVREDLLESKFILKATLA